MNCCEETPPGVELNITPILGSIFAIAWTSAHEALLPQLPQAIGVWLHASRVHLVIMQKNGVALHDYVYDAPTSARQNVFQDKPSYSFTRPLGSHLKLTLNIHGGAAADRASAQRHGLEQMCALIHAALDCLLVLQKDRQSLGPTFRSLSDREWLVCQALEGYQTEKQMAEHFAWSPHTLHTQVKSVYRKMLAQSRLEVVHELKQARLKIKSRRAIETLAQLG